jgi:hypothetical protein
MRRPFLPRDFIFHFQCFGGVTASVFIAFLKRLLIRAGRVIFLIRDRGPAHNHTKNQGVCRKPERIASAVLSSSYSPDRNPDACAGEGRHCWPHGGHGRRCGAVRAQSKLDSRLDNLP